MKPQTLKAVAWVFFLLAIFSGIVSGYQESKIIGEQTFVRSTNNSRELVIKGKTFFVNEERYIVYRVSEVLFGTGCIGLLLVLAANRFRKKD